MQIHATLQHYAHVIRQRLLIILLAVACCAGITGIVSFCVPPVYQAKSLLKVNTIAISTNNDVYSMQALAMDYALLVTSPEVLSEAARKIPGMSAGRLQQAVSDAPIENTQIIEIRAQAEDAQLAADMANMVAKIFIQWQAGKETSRLQSSANLLTQHIATTRLDLDAAQAYLNVLQENHAAPASIAQQRSLVDTDQANYGLLLTDYGQLQVQKLQVTSILSIAQSAQPPTRPVNSQPLTTMLLAAAMSLLFMIPLVLLLDWLDTTIKTREDIINLTGLTPLACIPAGSKAESAQLLNLASVSGASVRDALSTVGTNLRLQLRGQRFLFVSGTRAGAGASTVAVYLAISLARAGLRILLLDANLRRPRLHEVFHMPNSDGLSNRLGDLRRFQEQPALYPQSWLQRWKTPVANVWLLPAGPPSSSTLPDTMMLANRAPDIQELQELKSWLLEGSPASAAAQRRPIVDLIICDTAPLGEGSETYTWSMVADGVVAVVEAGKEQKELLCDTHAPRLHAPILGVVINRQKAWHSPYYYAGRRSSERTIATQAVSATRSDSAPQAATLHVDPQTQGHEEQGEQAAGAVIGRAFVTTSLSMRKVAERPPEHDGPVGESAYSTMVSQPAAQVEVPQALATRKLARVTWPMPRVAGTSSLIPSHEYSASTPLPGGGLSAGDALTAFLSGGERSVITDPLAGSEGGTGGELLTARMVSGTRLQFKIPLNKRYVER